MLDLKTDFGAVGDGTANDTAAFVSAEASGEAYTVPTGVYNVTTWPATSGASVLGAGRAVAIVRSTTDDQPAISFGIGTSHKRISGLCIDRTMPAISGGNGVDAMGGGGDLCLDEIIVQNQWNGLRLGPTDIASVSNARIQGNYADGILFTDAGFSINSSPLQWNLDNILLQSNDGHDIHVHPVVAPCTVEEWSRIFTYASTGHGVFAEGSLTCTINNIRMSNSFLGSNNTDLVKLDTYSGGHQFNNIALEKPGNIATGRTSQTPASHTGIDFNITPNNGLVQITNKWYAGNGADKYIDHFFSCLNDPMWRVMKNLNGEGWWGIDQGGGVYAGWAQLGPLIFGTATSQPIRWYIANALAMALQQTGELEIAKATGFAGAPGPGVLKLGVLAGTNTGTAKIVAYAGTSTTPVTITDNIGSGF